MTNLILVNFGGPRSLEEIPPFLTELLTDVEVIRTGLPRWVDNCFFRGVARRRARKIGPDYQLIGGRSPIYDDTEELAAWLRLQGMGSVITFHRYLPATHRDSLRHIEESSCNELAVLPMYPQFSYATTGSIARFFHEHLEETVLQKLRWIYSYPDHPSYLDAMERCIRDYLLEKKLELEETVLFFSAHGLPQKFVDEGDPYRAECHRSFEALRSRFPAAVSILAFQSKFGRGEWLRPYTLERCQHPHLWNEGRKEIVFVPLSFTSDHIETLFEIEHLYLPEIRARGLRAHRCPALNRRDDWREALLKIVQEAPRFQNNGLIRFSSSHT